MIEKPRVHFNLRTYQCVDCGDRFNYNSSFNTHYKMHKLQPENFQFLYEFADDLSTCQEHEQYTGWMKDELEQTCNGKFIMLL